MDFDEIPFDWLEPSTLLEVKANYRNIGILPFPTQNLIAAQKLAGGSLVAGQIVEVTRAEEGIALFGRGSIGAEMVATFRKANKTQPLFVTALADDGAALKATGKFTFAGALPAATVLRFKVAGRPIRFTGLTTDTAAQLATKLTAAINADLDNTVTAAANAAEVTCTSRHGGEVGNEIDLRIDAGAQPVPAGLTITVTPMAGGAGNPDLQNVLDLLTNTWFTDVAHPWNDATNLAKFVEWLRVRYTATSKLDVHGYVFKRGTYGELGTFGMLTNSPFLTAIGLNRSPTSSWKGAAAAMAIAAFQLTNDPARQLRSLVLPDVEAPDPADQFTEEEQNLLLNKGISSLDHLADGTTTISRMITTYKVSNLGVADRAWLDIMVPKTMSRIRYDWAGYVSLMYPRSKLVEDEDIAALSTSYSGTDGDPGNAVVTPGRMAGSWAARCDLYGKRVWIRDVARTVRESVFQISGDDKNRMESRQQVDIVGNLMVFAGSLEFHV